MPSTRAIPLVLLPLALVLAGCPDPPGATTNTVALGLRLDIPRQAERYDRTWSLYLGEPVDTVRMRLSVASLPPGAELTVLSGSGLIRRVIRGNGVTLDTLPGNVARLRLTMPGLVAVPPAITVDTVWLDRSSRIVRPPVEIASLANRVSAYPLTPHEPVDVHLAPGGPTNFFFSVQGLSGPAVDVLLFGPGQVRVSAPENGGDWPHDAGSAMWTAPFQAGGGPPDGFAFVRIPLQGRTRLFFAVSPDTAAPAGGHARFVVLPVSAPAPLSFPSSTPSEYLAGVIGIDYNPAAGANIADCTSYTGAPGFIRLPPACYDGHQGLDWLLTGGQAAQTSGVPVNAARPGIVLATDAAHADDCFWNPRTQAIQCADPNLPANFVAVRHDDGLFAYYFHLKTGSVLVAPGTPIACGQRVGLAGSSGQSAMPHLHLELRDLTPRPEGRLASLLHAPVRDSSGTFDPYRANTWRGIERGMPRFDCG